MVTIVTDNGGPLLSSGSSMHQNGSRERGFGTFKYERPYIDEINEAVMPAKHTEDYRIDYNKIRPHEAGALQPAQGRASRPASPTTPTFPPPKPCRLLDAGRGNPPILAAVGRC